MQALFTAEELAGYIITLEILPDQIIPRDNSVTTDWLDVGDQIKSKSLAVTKNNKDASEEFLQTLASLQKMDYRTGAVTKWAVLATGPREIKLSLLGLPASMSRIKASSVFRMDNCPALILGSLMLTTPFNKLRTVKGPMPTVEYEICI